MLAKKTFKNQITIPKAVLEGIEDVEYFSISRDDDSIVLKPILISDDSILKNIRKKIKALGIRPDDIKNAIYRARKS